MLELSPMEPAEKESLVRDHGESYAADISRTQDVPIDKARERVAAQRKGLQTDNKNEFFYHLTADNTRVGRLWLTRLDEKMFLISYIEILPEHRGKGFGKQALALAETAAQGLGARQIWLHVFADNTVAKSLYGKAGFRESGMQMFKNLH